MNSLSPRLWQRQPGEAPGDFTAFATYLRLKGRRSHRTVAAHTGRSLGAIRRLSSQFNWLGRVAAFEARLADASQDALDLLVRATSSRTTADYERMRIAEYQLAQRVLHESRRWLRLASDPRRRDMSLHQICRLTELASKLGRLAAGMPTGDEPRRRPKREEAPGYWTAPSFEEAIKKIYGSRSDPVPVPSPGADAGDHCSTEPPNKVGRATPCAPGFDHPGIGAHREAAPPASQLMGTGTQSGGGVGVPPTASITSPPPECHTPPEPRRRDAWSTFSRLQRRAASIRQG